MLHYHEIFNTFSVLAPHGEPVTSTPSILLKRKAKEWMLIFIEGPPAINEVRNQRNRWSTFNSFTMQLRDCF